MKATSRRNQKIHLHMIRQVHESFARQPHQLKAMTKVTDLTKNGFRLKSRTRHLSLNPFAKTTTAHL